MINLVPLSGSLSQEYNLLFYLQDFRVYVLNPLMTHTAKRKSLRKIKTNPVDVERIAQAFCTADDLFPYQPQDDINRIRRT